MTEDAETVVVTVRGTGVAEEEGSGAGVVAVGLVVPVGPAVVPMWAEVGPAGGLVAVSIKIIQ